MEEEVERPKVLKNAGKTAVLMAIVGGVVYKLSLKFHFHLFSVFFLPPVSIVNVL